MNIDTLKFKLQYQSVCVQLLSIEQNKAYWPYTSHPDWLWLDGQRKALEWVSKESN